MKGSLTISLLATLASVSSQAVTAVISAPGGTPSGCAVSENGVFGIQVVAAGAAMKKRQATQIADGQVQAGNVVTAIADGQIQAPTGKPATPVTAIADGQIQAPAGAAATPVTAIADGQIQAPKAATPVTAIADGQIQAPAGPVTVTVTKNNCMASPVTQIGDGQIQAPMATPITAIADGQIQAPAGPAATPVTAIADGQIQAPGATPVTAIADGQIQAPGATPVTAIGDGQPQAPGATPVTAIGDGQPQAATTLATMVRPAGMSTGSTAGGNAILAGAPQACASTTGVLKLTLADGILKDGQGRIGYIASNSQFQFDGPPQAGAIYTAGWSVCSSGLLALGSDTSFYRCLSGGFYNLYLDNVLGAAQCEEINLEVIQLNAC